MDLEQLDPNNDKEIVRFGSGGPDQGPAETQMVKIMGPGRVRDLFPDLHREGDRVRRALEPILVSHLRAIFPTGSVEAFIASLNPTRMDQLIDWLIMLITSYHSASGSAFCQEYRDGEFASGRVISLCILKEQIGGSSSW